MLHILLVILIALAASSCTPTTSSTDAAPSLDAGDASTPFDGGDSAMPPLANLDGWAEAG